MHSVLHNRLCSQLLAPSKERGCQVSGLDAESKEALGAALGATGAADGLADSDEVRRRLGASGQILSPAFRPPLL